MILAITMILWNCSFSQCDTNSVCTKKSVLSYLYEQNVRVGQLSSDTTKLRSIIRDHEQKSIQLDSLVSNRNQKIANEQQKNELILIEKKAIEDSNKKLSRKNLFISIVAIVSNILKSIGIGYLLLH